MSTKTKPVRIALFSGSIREDSINQKLVNAVAHILKDLGAKPVKISLRDYEMPIFNEDFEKAEGVPKTAKNLVRRLKSMDGVFIATPEYNGGLPALLKNTIDWTTRIGLEQFSAPVYGIGAATPGAMSGIMAARDLHFLLTRLGSHVVATQACTGFAGKAFGKKDRLIADNSLRRATMMAQQMLTVIEQRR